MRSWLARPVLFIYHIRLVSQGIFKLPFERYLPWLLVIHYVCRMQALSLWLPNWYLCSALDDAELPARYHSPLLKIYRLGCIFKAHLTCLSRVCWSRTADLPQHFAGDSGILLLIKVPALIPIFILLLLLEFLFQLLLQFYQLPYFNSDCNWSSKVNPTSFSVSVWSIIVFNFGLYFMLPASWALSVNCVNNVQCAYGRYWIFIENHEESYVSHQLQYSCWTSVF